MERLWAAGHILQNKGVEPGQWCRATGTTQRLLMLLWNAPPVTLSVGRDSKEYWMRGGTLANANISFRQFILNHGRDNHHYESLFVEVPETLETPSLRLCILYYLGIIEHLESTNGNNPFRLHVADGSGLQGVNKDCLSRPSITRNSRKSSHHT